MIKNNYCNLIDIKTYDYNDIDVKLLDIILDFIIDNWSYDKKYRLNKTTLSSYFIGHNNNKCFFGIYYNNNMIISTITDIPFNMTLSNKKTYIIRYVDNLCVDLNYRKKGIASEMIETHSYMVDYIKEHIIIIL
jgi:hypothetical protein